MLRPAFRPGTRKRGGAASAADDSAEWKVWVVESVVTSRLRARQDLLDAVEHFRRDDRVEVAANINLPVFLGDLSRIDRVFQDPCERTGREWFAFSRAEAVLSEFAESISP